MFMVIVIATILKINNACLLVEIMSLGDSGGHFRSLASRLI